MIEKYSFGSIVVDGKQYTSDIKIIDGVVIPNWWRKEGHSLCREDIEDIIEEKPDTWLLVQAAPASCKYPINSVSY